MGRWNCGRGVGICALALGVGILIAAIFPVGAVSNAAAPRRSSARSFAPCSCRTPRTRAVLPAAVKGGKKMRIIVWKAPAFLRGILRCLFCGKE